jgi:hypothetical protein
MQTGINRHGSIEGHLVPTGATPSFAEKFRKAGESLDLAAAAEATWN